MGDIRHAVNAGTSRPWRQAIARNDSCRVPPRASRSSVPMTTIWAGPLVLSRQMDYPQRLELGGRREAAYLGMESTLRIWLTRSPYKTSADSRLQWRGKRRPVEAGPCGLPRSRIVRLSIGSWGVFRMTAAKAQIDPAVAHALAASSNEIPLNSPKSGANAFYGCFLNFERKAEL